MSKLVTDMDAVEKAALLESIAKIMEANKTIGVYPAVERAAANTALFILNSIK